MKSPGKNVRIGVAIALVVALACGVGFGLWNMTKSSGGSGAEQIEAEPAQATEDSASAEQKQDAASGTTADGQPAGEKPESEPAGSKKADSEADESAKADAEKADSEKADSAKANNEKTDAEKQEAAVDEQIPVHQGTLAVATEGENADPVVAEDAVLGLIGITIQDASIQLPYAMADLLAQGWEADSTVDAGKAIEPMANLTGVSLHAAGNPDARIEVDVTNLGDESVTWDQAYCTGVKVPAGSTATMSCAAGFGTQSSFDEVYELLGAGTNAYRKGTTRTVELQIIVDAGEQHPIAGKVAYAAEDDKGGLSELYVALTAFRDRPDTPEGQQRPDQPSQPEGPGGPGGGGPGGPGGPF